MQSKFGTLLKGYLINTNVKEKDLAQYLNYDMSYINKWVNGVKLPSQKNKEGYLMYLIDKKLEKYGFSIGNYRDDNKRTGHVALVHKDAIRINAAMKHRGIIPDFRFPDVIRLAPVPLYTSYTEIYDMVEIIIDIMENKEYEKFENKRGTVA